MIGSFTEQTMKSKIKILVFRVARALGLFAAARRLTASKVRILCYHGGCLGDESQYNPKLFCSAATLARRMAWLQRKGFHLVTLDQAVAASRTAPGDRPGLTTAITFDDGWYSTASEMVPVLARMGIPSTLYLCTSHYLEGWAIASVTVRYLIWKSGLNKFQLTGFGLADGELDLSTPALRNQAANRIVAALEAMEPARAVRHAALEQLALCLQVSAADLALASRRFEYLNQQELLALPAQGCQIELHGHVHKYPAGQSDVFRDDLQRCSDTIEAAGLPRPNHYCYPSGDFDAAASATMATMNVVSATTCLPGLVTQASATECHYLPRFLDGESIEMIEFEAEMSGFYDLARRLLGKRHPLQPA